MENIKARIFLAEERVHTETEWTRSYNTFCFGNYTRPSNLPFGPLFIFSDDVLAGGRSMELMQEQHADLVLLPTVGAIQYRDSVGNESIVGAGEVAIFSVPQHANVEIRNPYENGLVNFLQFWIRKPSVSLPIKLQSGFELALNENRLIDLLPSLEALVANTAISNLSLGRFKGRQETTYRLLSPSNGAFVFAVEGAFEVCNRLLETRDGLALWNASEIEMEALSNNAIILFVELAL